MGTGLRCGFGVGPRVAGVGEADGPPVEAAEHGIHRALEAVGVAERAVGVELLPCAGEGDAVAHGDGVEFCENKAELFDGAKASGDSAVGDECDGLGVPLGAVRIDQGLQRGSVAVVVLGRDDDEGIAGGEALSKSLARFGRVRLGGIDVFDREACMSGNAGCGPLGDRVAEAAGAG